MVICEHTISEYTLNGKALYNVIIVYKISNRGKELLAQLTVDLEEHKAHLISIGTEFTDSKAEYDRIQKLRHVAGSNAKRYACMCELEGPDNFYRHVDCRK